MKTTNLTFLYFTIALFTVFTISCGNDNKNNRNKPALTETITVKAPRFNEDSAYNYLKTQVEFGPRVTGSESWQRCSSFLEKKLRSYADTVFIQQAVVRTFNGLNLKANNIIASFNPESTKRILLAAHWDSRPFADMDPNPANRSKPIEGANDGASGVAVLLEIARLMSSEKPPVGVDIILFDAEDYGITKDKKDAENSEYTWGLGSQYWARNPHIAGYNASFGILLDMVGTQSPNFAQEGYSLHYAPDIVKKVWATAEKLGYSSFFTEKEMGFVTDDHYYVNKFINIPMIDIIHNDPTTSSGFFPFWHTTLDKISNIDKNTLKIVGQTVTTVIWEEE